MRIKNHNIDNKVAFKSIEGKDKIIKCYDELLNKWDFPHKEFYISTSFGNTFVIASGEKRLPPLILIHGTGMNSVMWIKEIEKYSSNYRVYAVDIPGEPGKSNENEFDLEKDDFADWLKDIFNGLLIKRANIVGLSLGGWISIKFSLKYPQSVNKLVLLCPAGVGPQKKSFMFKCLFYRMLGDRGLDKIYYKINGNKPMSKVMLNYKKLIVKYFNFRKIIIPLFSDIELRQLKMPIALFVGGRDIIIHSCKTVQRLSSLVPNIKIYFLKKEGHDLVKQADDIMQFLEITSWNV